MLLFFIMYKRRANNRKNKVSNKMKTTYMGRCDTASMLELMFKGLIQYSTMERSFQIVSTAQLQPNFDSDYISRTFSTAFNDMTWVTEMWAGRMPAVDLVNSSAFGQDQLQVFNIYTNDNLKKVTALGKTPGIKSIKWKVSMYTPVVVLALADDSGFNLLKRDYFFTIIRDFLKSNRIIEDRIRGNYWEPEILGPAFYAKQVVQEGVERGVDQRPLIFEQKSDPSAEFGVTEYLDEETNRVVRNVRPSNQMEGTYVNPLKYPYNNMYMRNPNLISLLVDERKRAIVRFKKELMSLFGDSLTWYDDVFVLNLVKGSKKTYFCVPLLDPTVDTPSVRTGYKNFQVVVTHDPDGVAAELAQAMKQKKVLKPLYDKTYRRRVVVKKKYVKKYSKKNRKGKYGNANKQSYKRKSYNPSKKPFVRVFGKRVYK